MDIKAETLCISVAASIISINLLPHKPRSIFANRLRIRVNQAKIEQIYNLVGTDSKNCESYGKFEKSHITYSMKVLNPNFKPQIPNPKTPNPKLTQDSQK